KDDVLRELRADGALTAAELVERTRLSRPTIISLLRELEEDGWVSSEIGGHGAPGRPATAWAPASRAGIVIGADVLVDSMLTVVSTFHGRVLEVRTDQLVDRCREARLDVV
ncbi:winged helix-turn-helix transcriptional regulator, partial [Xanthomonas citri pv. citri]|nr:winged helix-turn-helix transcriptional regulator [Xanthomonas citri pv. citri]